MTIEIATSSFHVLNIMEGLLAMTGLICTYPPNNVIFPSVVVAAVKEEIMSDLNLVLGWGSPIGIGIFLICLGAMIYLLSKVGDKKKQ